MIELCFTTLVRENDACLFEVYHVIVITHKEEAIIFLFFKFCIFSALFVPEFGFVRPIAIPFSVSPRISQLNQTNILVFILDCFDIDQRVSMSLNQTSICFGFPVAFGRCAHEETLVVMLYHFLEEVGLFSFVSSQGFVLMFMCGYSPQVLGCKGRKSGFSSEVSTVQFSPCLFKDHDPQLCIMTFSKSRHVILLSASKWRTGEEIVNDHGSFPSIYVKVDQVNPGCIHFQ